MAATITVTGATGPGTALTAKVFTNVITFSVDTPNNMLSFTQSGSQQTVYVTIVAAATVTATKSTTTWTLTIS